MNASILRIVGRRRAEASISQATLKDFETASDGTIPASELLTNRRTSIYCLDHARRQVVFIESGSDVDLTRAPFFYQEQFARAERLILLPYDELFRLAATIGDPFQRLVLIFSTGRAGSTLLSKLFEAAPGVTSLSEPDVYTQLAYLREGGAKDEEISRLLTAITRLLFAPLRDHAGGTLVLKFRGQATSIGDLFCQGYPDARVVFAYRNLRKVLESGDGIWGSRHARSRWALRAPLLSTLLKRRVARKLASRRAWLERNVRLDCPLDDCLDMGFLGPQLIATLSIIDSYLALLDGGAKAIGIRFEDLLAHPEETVSGLFRHCDLPEPNRDLVRSVFAVDSQKGTRVASGTRERSTLDSRDLALLRRFLAHHRSVRDVDFVLPGTLTPTMGAQRLANDPA